MGIYRGPGGTGDAVNDASSEALITIQARDAALAAQAAAEAAQAAAELAETNAETAETNAELAETNAETAETNAETAATNAASSASAASTSASNAASSASAASTSASNAATSATNASNSASAASTSATNAASSASAASTSATNASNSASAAATSATNASNSASAAATSATNAANSATAAQTAETNAETAETNAAASASAASTSASNAASSASAASTSASNAATSATNASNSASAAATSATNASNSASAASTSATNASNSASAAATSATNAAASYDSFDDRYLGAKSSAPSVDNDGNTLLVGALYFNTTTNEMKVWDGSTWLNAYASLSGALLATNNLSDLNNTTTARTNLGLGSIATQAASSVTITGGTINGTTVGATTAASGKFTTLEATGVATFSAGTVSAPALTTSGDTNTGIFFPAADTIAFTEGGVESMRINSSSNLLIGTATNPSSTTSRLVVAGSSGGGYQSVGSSNTGGALTVGLDSGGQSFYTYSGAVGSESYTERIRIDSNGAVIVGGTAAQATAVNRGNITINGASNSILAFTAAGTLRAYVYSDGTNFDINNQANGYMSFQTSGTERMRITSAGNVGIGRTDPGARLDVTSSTALSARITGPTNAYFDLTDGTGTFRTQLLSNTPYLTSIGAYDLILGTNNTERMRILSGGNVGIGTSNISARLHVTQSDANNGTIKAESNTTNEYAGVTFFNGATTKNSGSRNYQLANNYSNFGNFDILSSTTSTGNPTTSRVTIDSSGNVGIGTSSPAARLDVNGAGIFRGTLTPTDALTLGGNTSAPTADAFVYRPANNTLALGTASTERMRIDSSGNLLIGRTSTPADGFARIAVVNSSDTAIQITKSGVIACRLTAVTTGLAFGVDGADGATERMRIDSSGNVMIGTTSTLNSASGRGSLSINGSTDSILAFGNSGSVSGYLYSYSTGLELTTVGSRNLVFQTSNTERMRIDTSGNVGIGTSSPAYKLTVYGTAAFQGTNLNLFNTAASSQTTLTSDQVFSLNHYFATGSAITFGTNASGAGNTERMRIDSSGNVGIGTSSPAYKLDVSGGIAINAKSLVGSSGYFICGVNGFRWNNSTDGVNNVVMYDNGTTLFRNAISVGNVTPTTSGAGITFPATQSASSDANTLDDYEEGTFTPIIRGSGGLMSSVTYTSQLGRYTKIGDTVFFALYVSWSAASGGSGDARIGGLPFSAGDSYASLTPSVYFNVVTNNDFQARTNADTTIAIITTNGSSGFGLSVFTSGSFNKVIAISGCYKV